MTSKPVPMELTVDSTMVKTLPVVARNPFTLALLDPAVVNRYTLERTVARHRLPRTERFRRGEKFNVPKGMIGGGAGQ